MDFLTLNANPKQCLTKQGDEKRGKKKEAERGRNAQAFQKAEEKIQAGNKREKQEASNRSEVVGNKNY